MKLFCRIGLHRYEAVEAFEATNTIYGLECRSCGKRKLTIGGARPRYPGTPGTTQYAVFRAERTRAQKWAARNSPAFGLVPVWWR